MYVHWISKLAIDAMAHATNCPMGKAQPNEQC